jgi:MerR family copper efflux transcriptional regulator
LSAADRTDSPAPSREGLLQIGEVAERIGLSLRTVRYYEEVGLVTPSDRTPGGFRLYSEDDVARLRVLKGMKPFGLSLEEIGELMRLFDESAGGAHDGDRARLCTALERYHDRAEARIGQLEEHAGEVRRLRDRIRARLEDLGAPGA